MYVPYYITKVNLLKIDAFFGDNLYCKNARKHASLRQRLAWLGYLTFLYSTRVMVPSLPVSCMLNRTGKTEWKNLEVSLISKELSIIKSEKTGSQ